MMLNKMRDKVDLSVLDEIVGLCEDAMLNPLSKKKKASVAIIQKESPEEEEGDEKMMMAEEDGPKKEDLSEDDLRSLLEDYMKLKG